MLKVWKSNYKMRLLQHTETRLTLLPTSLFIPDILLVKMTHLSLHTACGYSLPHSFTKEIAQKFGQTFDLG
jgi:hypothetical protein